jgi:hypothetical protein
MRTTQLATDTPLRKKIAATAMRARITDDTDADAIARTAPTASLIASSRRREA